MELKEEKKREVGESKGGRERGRREEYEVGERERERPREKWAPSKRGQPRATSHDATLLREGFVPRSWTPNARIWIRPIDV